MADDVPSIYPSQVRAARAWLFWSQKDLAKVAGLSVQSVNRFENSDGSPDRDIALRLRTAFESAGIQFEFNGTLPAGIHGPTEPRRRLKPRYRRQDDDPA
ncbi:DNA-binding XRE family transcriptional regulator [Bradyrhizobium sp. USDA 4341]